MIKRLGYWPAWCVYAGVLAVAPLCFDSSLGLTILSQIYTVAIITLSYNLLYGQTGLLSFGHAIYVGLGAYIAAHALNLASAFAPWFPVSLIPLVGGIGGALVAVVLGYLSTRKSGTSFAMITLGLGELVAASALMFPGFFGGEAGVAVNRVIGPVRAGISYGPQIEVYGLIAFWLFVSSLAMFALTRTPLGRLANAVRDNAERVAFVGYDPRHVRFLVMLIAGFFAGIAGGLSALNFEIVSAENVGTVRSGAYLLFTVIGGAGFFFGPILGAVLYALAFLLLSEWTRAWLLYLGLFFVALVVLAPGGLAGIVAVHVEVLRAGWGRALGRLYAVVVAALVMVAGAMVVLVEMAYRLRLGQGQALAASPWGPYAGSWLVWSMTIMLGLAGCLLLRRYGPALTMRLRELREGPA